MKFLPVLTAALLCVAARPASAAYLTGSDLLRECQSKKSADVVGCMNYVAGVIDYQVMQQSLGTEPSVDFCLPDDVTMEKAAVTVMFYLRKNPQLGSFIAAPSVPMALHEAYPCAPMKARSKKKHKHG